MPIGCDKSGRGQRYCEAFSIKDGVDAGDPCVQRGRAQGEGAGMLGGRTTTTTMEEEKEK
jgi:hypothetical protein